MPFTVSLCAILKKVSDMLLHCTVLWIELTAAKLRSLTREEELGADQRLLFLMYHAFNVVFNIAGLWSTCDIHKQQPPTG